MKLKKFNISLINWLLVLFSIYFISFKNYLLFHSLVEIFSILIAWTVFILAWNSKERLDNHYFLLIGIAYIFVGGIDLLHTLAYKGMGVFPGSDANLPTQLWISARYMESLSLLIATFFITRKLKSSKTVLSYIVITTIILLSIFYWGIFPDCFIEGQGLTWFKKISEYIISGVLFVTIIILNKNRHAFAKNVFQLLIAALATTILAEFAFTFYVSVFGFSNVIGHYFKIISFYLIYKSVIETGIKKPFNILFMDLKRQEEKLKTIIKGISDALIVTDKDHKIILINRATEELFNIQQNEVLKRPVDEVINMKNLVNKIKETINEEGKGLKCDFEIYSEDSLAPVVMCAHTSKFYDDEDNILGTVTIISDVSFERKVERMKTNFLNIAAHEIRNPLTSIFGFSELLLSRDNLSDEEKKYFLSLINHLASDLNSILTDLLNISRIEAGRELSIEKNEIVIDEFIRNAAVYFMDMPSKHTFEFDLPDKDTKIKIDSEKFKLLINNLISNAFKYSPDGGKIKITGRISDDELYFSVEDEGIGMTGSQVERIFEEFYRAHPSDKRAKGTGLGMSIVKHIIELHNGNIWIESEIDKGTKVSFSLPLN